MKKWIFVFVLILFSLNFAIGQEAERFSCSQVIQTDSIDKQSIFVSIKEWLSMNFKSAGNAIELEDKEAGILVANASSVYHNDLKPRIAYLWSDGSLKYTINIQIRDGRFKVTTTNFRLKCSNNEHYDPFGFITVEEEGKMRGAGKKQHNEVWQDLKIKAREVSDDWFNQFASIKFKDFKNGDSEDW